MKRIQIMVYALLLLVSVSALLPAASDSTLDIISYDDQGIERSLAGGCSSTARVTCVLANSEGVPCEGNLQVVNSDCKNKVKQPQKVEVTWQYCNNNTGTVVQNVDLNRTVAVYKKSEQETTTAKLRAGECRTITRKPKINLCKRGAAMSMKYRGSLSSGQICYAYNFVRVKTKRLRRKKAKCAVTTEITCQINEGANIGSPCAGNIINDGAACKTVKVQFTYKICVFNRDANKMFINPNKSIAKMQGTKVPLNTKNMVTKNSPCRMDTKDAEIGTCSTNDVNAMLKVRGRLNTGKKCRSKSYLKIRAAEPCTYNFIITELVSNGSKSYIEIYSPNCRNAVVAEDFQIVRYNNPGKETPNRDNPITLRGLETNENGFIIICASEQAGQEFCENVNEETATLTGTDTIAIISGTIDTGFSVSDVFGSIPKPNSDTQLALQDFSGSQAVRNEDATGQDPTFDSGHWTITSMEEYNLTPGSWHDINNNFVPRSEETATNSPSAQPSVCDTEPYIAEVVIVDNKVQFIELRAKSICAYGMSIPELLTLELDGENVVLGNLSYDERGFLVICNSQVYFPDETCNGVYDTQSLVDGDGDGDDDGSILVKILNDGTNVEEKTFQCGDPQTCRYHRNDSIGAFNIGDGNGSPGKVNSSSKSPKSSKSDSKSPSESPTNSQAQRNGGNTDSPSQSPSKSSKSPKSVKSESGKGSKNPSNAPTPQMGARDAENTGKMHTGSGKGSKSPSGKGSKSQSRAPSRTSPPEEDAATMSND